VTVVDTGLNTQTGGRIKRVKDYVNGETFMMTYGDGVGNIELDKLLAEHRNSKKVATLTAVQPTGRYGVLDLDDTKNLVVGFREKAREDNNWINAGFMVLEPRVFDYINGDDTIFERKPLEMLTEQEELGVYRHYDYWQCMDTQRDKYALEVLLQKNIAPWCVWNKI
jgi:glucose-1-phosphate cytidylyltransferase